MMDKYKGQFSQSFSNTALDVLNPSRSIIVDMIMVQILAAIVVLTMLLLFKGGEIGQQNASYLLVGLFATVLFLSAVYSRITRG
tara:strand:- start:1867 stop:2118 length:252 start_codon:yes stop_codon:yes gene_type:complete